MVTTVAKGLETLGELGTPLGLREEEGLDRMRTTPFSVRGQVAQPTDRFSANHACAAS
jgi:hypothetical protein